MIEVVYSKILRLRSIAYRLGVRFDSSRANMKSAAEQRDAFYDQMWRHTAKEFGASIKDLGYGILEIALNDARTRVCGTYTALDDPVTLMLAGNKSLVHRLLAEHGLPTPNHAVFTLHSLRTAEEFLERAAGDCVVKPAKNTGAGRGVTTGIRSRSQLASAISRAAAFGRELLIEEQVPGDNYRLLYLGGRLLDAIVRRPPQVKGDGRRTIHELVEGVNRGRLSGGHKVAQVLVPVDRDMEHTLAKQGLSLKSVPAEGQAVILKTVVNDNGGLENETASHYLCEAIVGVGAAATKAAGVTLAGVDIITQDPTRPLSETGGVILEVNTSPGFYFHYRKKDGPFPVARFVLAELFGNHEPDIEDPLLERQLQIGIQGVRHGVPCGE